MQTQTVINTERISALLTMSVLVDWSDTKQASERDLNVNMRGVTGCARKLGETREMSTTRPRIRLRCVFPVGTMLLTDRAWFLCSGPKAVESLSVFESPRGLKPAAR